MSVPSNLVPTSILQLPEDPAPSNTAWMVYVNNGVTYKVQVNAVLNVSGVPSTRVVAAGTGLTGGGALSSNITISVAPGGIGATELDATGVTAGVYGDSANYPVLTIDANGRVTAATELSFPSPSGFVPTSREVIAGVGLSGGGALTTNVTLNANLSDANPEPVGAEDPGTSDDISRADHVHPAIDLADTTQTVNELDITRGGTGTALTAPPSGGIVYSDGTALQVSTAGTLGQVLVSAGSSAPTWGSALIVSDQPANYVYAGPTSGPDAPTAFRALVNADLPASGVTAASYGTATAAPVITVNDKGVATSISTITITPAVGSITGLGAGVATWLATPSSANLAAAVTDETGSGALVFGTNPTLSSPNINVIDFDTTYSTTLTAGQLGWDGNDTLGLGMIGGNVIQKIGEDQYFYCKATSAITKGQVVMFTGAVGASGVPTGAPATGITDGTYIMGIAAESIAHNGFGLVQSFGTLRNVNTSGYADGDILWYNPSVAGGLTKTKPVAPNVKVQMAAVINGGSVGGGTILIRINPGSVLGGTDSNVQITSETDTQLLQYYGAGQYWRNINPSALTGVGSLANALTIGTGLSGTSYDGSSAVTIAIANSGVTASTYGSASQVPVFAVNAQGQLTSVTNTPIAIANTAVSGLGTMSTQDSNNVNITAGTIAVTADPTTNLQVATKQYVDTLVAVGINYHEAVYVESPDTAGNLTATYNNGTLGVGATLTNAGTQVALTIDGVLMTVGKRVLIYNQTNQFENGVYTVTTVGDGSTNWVLTRATDADSYGPGATALDEGSAFYVTNGSTGAGETYVCSTTGTIVFGTTAITFSQVSSAQVYSAGTGLTLTGTQFSITNTGTAGTYGSASQVPVFVTNAQGQVTSVTNTSIAIANTQVSGLGTMSTQNANSVAITGGAIDGTTIGGSTAAAGTFTTVTATSYSGIDGGVF